MAAVTRARLRRLFAGRTPVSRAELVRSNEALRSELTIELQEARRLHERVAELTDVVAELIVPALDRDDARVERALAAFSRPTY